MESRPKATVSNLTSTVSKNSFTATVSSIAMFLALGIGLAPAARAQFLMTETGGTFGANNLATRPGATAFAQDVVIGDPNYSIAHLNDGIYGNANSWLAGNSTTFVGINFGGIFEVDSIAFGRDNTGAFSDRFAALYTLQYTTSVNPGISTDEREWTSIGLLDYASAAPSDPNLRHLYELETPVTATGIRIIIGPGGGGGIDTNVQGNFLDSNIAIDELEVYGPSAVPEPNVPALAALGFLGFVFWRRKTLLAWLR